MEKRYQVFISSTFSDLKDERQAVMQALMEMDCIPAGMELFPAADEEQWLFIQKVINDCDYYVLILGGRYGSLTEDGVSYTEKEFDYAVSSGLKVIALIHKEPDQLPFAKVEASESAREKLSSFRQKVTTGRLVKYWSNPGELPGLVALSLQKTIKTYPAPGWVRGNQLASSEVLAQINNLRIENEDLKRLLSKENQNKFEISEDVSRGSDPFPIFGVIRRNVNMNITRDERTFQETWDSIFSKIGPEVIGPTEQSTVHKAFQRSMMEFYNLLGSLSIPKNTLDTIAIQLSALELIDISPAKTIEGTSAVFWNITEAGRNHLIKMRLVKKSG